MKKIVFSCLLMTLFFFSFSVFASAGLHGDVDSDGEITLSDARTTLRVTVGLDQFTYAQQLAADLNNDGFISAEDTRIITRAAVSLENIANRHIYTEVSIKHADGSVVTDRVCKVCGHQFSTQTTPPTAGKTEAGTTKAPTTVRAQEKTTVSEPTTKTEKTTLPEKTTKAEKTTVPEKTTKAEKTTAPEKTTVPESITVPEKTTAAEKTTAPEKTTVPEKTTKAEKTTAPEKTTKAEPVTSAPPAEIPDEPKEYEENAFVEIGGKKAYLGMTLADLTAVFGKHTAEYASFKDMKSYSFASDYSRYFAAYIKDSRAVAYYVCASDFTCGDLSRGDTTYLFNQFINGATVTYYTDLYNSFRLYAILLQVDHEVIRLDPDAKNCYENAAKQVFEITNAYRAQHGVPALAWDAQAAAVASAHSLDMAQYDYFTHTNRDGLSASQRAIEAGLTFRIYGENIAAGRGFPHTTVDQWINSEGHRNNLLQTKFTRLGVGAAYSGSSMYQYYWTQNFLAK